MQRVNWQGRGLERGKKRAGNHSRKLCRGEAEPVPLDWGQQQGQTSYAPPLCTFVAWKLTCEMPTQLQKWFSEPTILLKSFSLISGYISERAAHPASQRFFSSMDASERWRERWAAGGTLRQGSTSSGFWGATGSAPRAAGPAPQRCDPPSVFLEIFPLPRLTEMSCSVRPESSIQLCVSLCHTGWSTPLSSRSL